MVTVKDHFQYETNARMKTWTALLGIAFCAMLFIPHRDAAAEERGRSQNAATTVGYSAVPAVRHYPVYRIPLRVHLGQSGRSPAEFKAILKEINDIWLSQAGI